MKNINIEKYKSYIFETAKKILLVDSPSGYCAHVTQLIEEIVAELGYTCYTTNCGTIIVEIDGADNSKTVALTSHVDTLGTMVRSITENGDLKFTVVGGPIVPTLDGEYCKIVTRNGISYKGTYLSKSPSVHVYDDASSLPRTEENMIVRIDEPVRTKEQTEALGIMPGDYILINPKTTVTKSGFLKSRFIDDKGSVACLLALLKIMKEEGLKPQYKTKYIITTYEEVGHGGAYLPEDVSELLSVDMGCIGEDLSCSEYDVSICAKDSGGPYDYEMTTRLINFAKENDISFAVDIYPHYSSDATVAMRAGNNVRTALIGPGVHASHGMERTHYLALENTVKLLILYLGLN